MAEIKLFLHHAYDWVESGPAEELRRQGDTIHARLAFIPFGFATPTFGDVIVAQRDDEYDGHWTFEVPDAGGMDVEDLQEKGGYVALIVDFWLPDADDGVWFPGRDDIYSALSTACGPDEDGRVYFAVPDSIAPNDVMSMLRAAHPEGRFTLVHPS